MPDTRKPPLAEDLLRGAREIARHVYGDDSPELTNRIYHLHARKELPTFKIGNRICARKSALDARFAAE